MPHQINFDRTQLTSYNVKKDELTITISKATELLENVAKEYDVNLVIKNGMTTNKVSNLPKGINEISIAFPGYQSYCIFLPLPFEIEKNVIFSLTFDDGTRFEASGDAFRVDIGECTAEHEITYDVE